MNYNQLDKKTIILSLKKDDYINQSIQELFINEKMYPIELMLCDDCGLGQTKHTVNPKLLYPDFHYKT